MVKKRRALFLTHPGREINFKSKENQSWYRGETVIAGIGQGYMLTTPLQLAFATSMIANKGMSYKPHLVKGIRDSGLKKTEYIDPIMSQPFRWY